MQWPTLKEVQVFAVGIPVDWARGGSVSGTMSEESSQSLHAAFTFAFGILLAFRIRAKRAHRLAIPGA